MSDFNPADAASYPMWAQVTVRFCDQDPQGHVNNAAFVSYTEAVRVNLFDKARALDEEQERHYVLAHLGIDYRAELSYPAIVDAGIRLTGLGNSSIKTVSGMFVGGLCVAIATAVNVCIDAHTRKPVSLTDKARATLQEFGGSLD